MCYSIYIYGEAKRWLEGFNHIAVTVVGIVCGDIVLQVMAELCLVHAFSHLLHQLIGDVPGALF
ncbi:MAG: hypothetical protein WBP13_12395 [Methylophilaceae bacterium]